MNGTHRIPREPASVGLVGSSPALRDLLTRIERIAASDRPVLIQGEQGVGKRWVARRLHALSPRREGPFLELDLARVPPPLAERELFGDEDPLFAPAFDYPEGMLQAANEGTLSLQHPEALGADIQERLAQAVRHGQAPATPEREAAPIDLRWVLSTEAPVEWSVAAGRLQSDLLDALDAEVLNVPPLRERREDLPLLTDHLLQELMLRYAKRVRGISDEAAALVYGHRWEGNVKALREELERAVVLTPAGRTIEAKVLSPPVRASKK